MKKNFLFLILLLCSTLTFYGQVSVNTDNSDPDPAAMLDVKSTDKGVLIPRVALVSTTDPISAGKPDGLLVWNTSTTGNYPEPGFYYWDGSDWVQIASGSGTAASYEIVDSDSDTRISVEYATDEDTIRFFVAGTEVMKHDGKTLHVADTNQNVYIGNMAGSSNTDGDLNVALGGIALQSNTTGSYNIAIGGEALKDNTIGDSNIAIGGEALERNDAGNGNIAVGNRALFKNDNGFGNTAIGSQAGYQNISGDNNVFLGKFAGYNETGNNKLYIENSQALPEDALIYGDFDADQLSFNGKVGVNTITPSTELDVEGEIRSSNLAGGGNRLVQADGNGVLQSLSLPDSISIDSYPENLDCAPGHSGQINKLFIRDTIIYAVSSQGNQISNFDIKDPSNIDRKGWSAVDLVNPTSLFIEGDYAYVTSRNNSKLVIYDISNGYGFVHVTSTGISSPYDVYVVDDYAYVVSGNHRLSIFDVADPSAPVAMGYSSDGLSVPQAVWVHGNRAYVSSTGNDKLVIFDVTDKSAPYKLGETGTGLDYPQELCVDGDYAYFASRDTESIVIFNVSDPANPAHVSEFSDGINYPTGIFKDNNYIFVSCYNEGFVVIDVSDVNNPKKIAGFTNEPYSMYSWDVVYQSGIIYSTNQSLLCSYSLFGAGSYPIIGPDGSVSWNQLENANLWQINDTTNEVYYNEGYVGIGIDNPTSKLHVVGNIRSEYNIFSEGYVRADDYIQTDSYLESDALEGSGNRMLSADGDGRIEVLTPHDTILFDQNPETLSKIGISSSVDNIEIIDNVAFVTCYDPNTMFRSFDISDPRNITQLDYTSSGLSNAYGGLCIDGDYAYIGSGGNSELVIFDISDPSNLSFISTTSISNGPQDVAVKAGYAYVISSGGAYFQLHLSIYNVFDPLNPFFTGSISDASNNHPRAIEIDQWQPYAYIVCDNNLVIIDVSDPANPQKISEISTELDGGRDIYKKYNYVFVISSTNDKLVIFDVTDRANPIYISDYTEGLQSPGYIDVDGNYAYIGNVNMSHGYTIVNIEDETNPTMAVDISLNDYTRDIAVNSGYLFVLVQDIYNTDSLIVQNIANGATPTFSQNGSIQWTSMENTQLWELNDASNQVYYNDGNVGINTSDPTDKLDVNGQARIRDLSLDNNRDSIVVADGNGVLFSRAASTLGDNFGNHTATQNILTNGNWLSGDGGNEGLFVDASGNAGVGTSTPEYKFDVRGNRIRLKEDATGEWIALRTDGNAIDLQYEGGNCYFQSTTDGEHILLNPNRNSFVGIRTTGPDAPLHVAGGTDATLTGGGYIVSGNVSSRNIVMDDNEIVARDNNAASVLHLNRDGGNVILNEVSGNVGIGHSSPSTKLDVDGQTRIRSLSEDNTLDSFVVADGDGVLYSRDASTLGDNLGNHTATQNLKTSGNWISGDGGNEGLFIASNGSVGIGTSSPSELLHIYENHSSNYTAARLENGATPGQGGAQFEIKTDGNQFNLGVGGSANSSLGSKFYIYQQSAGARMVIDGIGNVGIGATSPASKLSNDATLCSDGTKSTNTDGINWRINGGGYALGIENAATGGSGLLVEAGNNSGTGSTVAHFVSNNASLMYIREDGNIGINTTSPSFDLHCNGSAGKPGGGSWSTASDERLKAVHGNFTRGLEEIQQINPVSYNYKQNNELDLPTEQEYVGVIAQEVQNIIPEAVEEMESGYLAVNNDPIIWALLNAIKEQQMQIENYKSVNQMQQKQIDDLAKRLETLENK